MVDSLLKPKARGGLMTADHSKRGQRFVTVLDPELQRVTLLEPWEHAILVLCDGNRTGLEIAEMLREGVEGEKVTLLGVDRCLQLFDRQRLLEESQKHSSMPSAGPRTLAGLQMAYREWHRDPVKTGQILAGYMDPFIEVRDSDIRPGLTPTVALPDEDEEEGENEDDSSMAPARPVAIGTTLVMGGSAGQVDEEDRALRSILDMSRLDGAPDRDEPQTAVGSLTEDEPDKSSNGNEDIELGDVADLLAAVDQDFERLEASDSQEDRPRRSKMRKAVGGIAEIPPATEIPRTASSVVTQAIEDPSRINPHIQPNVEVSLTPTMVGVAPENGDAPVLLAPPRSPSKAGDRVGAVVAPQPSSESRNVSVKPAKRTNSKIQTGAVVEATQRLEAPPHVAFQVAGSDDNQPLLDPTRVELKDSLASDMEENTEETNYQAQSHVHPRAREVFDQLWQLGLKARSYDDSPSDQEGEERRQARPETQAFQTALETLSAGDLDVALEHFRALSAKLPDSERVTTFVDAIEAVIDGATLNEKLFERFERAVAAVIKRGRCPQCFAILHDSDKPCPECGFEIGPAEESS